jgi:hypothetical protein
MEASGGWDRRDCSLSKQQRGTRSRLRRGFSGNPAKDRDMRRTIVVHTRLAGHVARVEAARAGEHGIQILMMGQLAARLAGGLLAPIDPDCLRDAVREALPEADPGRECGGMTARGLPTRIRLKHADFG